MSNPNANYFKEKLVLREEEKSLKEMLTKFQDQLNRLKIEELALLSHIKMQEDEKKKSTAATANSKNTGEDLRSTYNPTYTKKTSEAGSESSISSALPVGVMHQRIRAQPDQPLREELDLAVTAGLGLDQDLGDEEEEEEDDEEDEDPLCSFMDTV